MVARIINHATSFLAWVTGAVIIGIMLLTVTNVFLRYLFRWSLIGTVEITGYYLMVAIAFLPLAYGLVTKEGHVRVELLTSRLSPRKRAISEAAGLLLSLVIYICIVWYGAAGAYNAWKVGDVVPTVNIPSWPARALIPIGGSLLCLQLIIISLRRLFTPRS